MKLISLCNRVIEYSFYAIFLLVPLVFAGNTSELFEFNKMWITFGLTIFISLAWFTKMILQRKISIQRTPLDIPILLFLLSQILSTIFSLDRHVSWWGYYSRFNGGLLSTITYVFLYFAFVSNLDIKHVFRTLKVTLFGALIVALWGLPSHFGYDPTCLVFRGTFDTSCWTDAFKPTVRVFSTLGQPAWLAAYLATLIPVVAAYFLQQINHKPFTIRHKLYAISYLLLAALFYLDLIFANTRGGFLAFVLANFVFWLVIFVRRFFNIKIFIRYFLVFNLVLFACHFFFYSPFEPLNRFTLSSLKRSVAEKTAPAPAPTIEQNQNPAAVSQTQTTYENNITDSADIRKYVWAGAIDAWKSNALFGTGVETFAFAYYKFRPAGHNLTSEWDYLYNKAHNEYLNYLTTTGLLGLGSYLFFIGLFIFTICKWLMANGLWKNENEKNEKNHTPYAIRHTLVIGLFSGWVSILISNFFGFSVVIINLFLFIIPAFVFILNELLPNKKFELAFNSQLPTANSHLRTNPYQWTAIVALFIFSIILLISLIRYWNADVKYALGANLDRVGSYQEAYPLLVEAARIKPHEPVFTDELSINMAVLSTAFAQQKDNSNSAQFANNAIELSNQVVKNHPNNVVFWKDRVRLFYTLAQATPSQQMPYYQEALKAIEQAHILAPTDAKIGYNLGVLYGQTGNIPKAIEILEQTVKLKPDYRDPYFALGIFYHESSLDANKKVIHPELQQKAIEAYEYILKNIDPNDAEVKKSLAEWGAQ